MNGDLSVAPPPASRDLAPSAAEDVIGADLARARSVSVALPRSRSISEGSRPTSASSSRPPPQEPADRSAQCGSAPTRTTPAAGSSCRCRAGRPARWSSRSRRRRSCGSRRAARAAGRQARLSEVGDGDQPQSRHPEGRQQRPRPRSRGSAAASTCRARSTRSSRPSACRSIASSSASRTTRPRSRRCRTCRSLALNLQTAVGELRGALSFDGSADIFEAKQAFATTSRSDSQTPRRRPTSSASR